MVRSNAKGEMWKMRGCAWGVKLLLGALLLLATSCVTPGMTDSASSRDLLEIKDQLNQLIAKTEQANRKLDYQISTLSDNLTNKIDGLQNSTDNSLQQLQAVQADLQSMKGQLESIDFAIRKMPGAPAGTLGTTPAPAPAPLPGQPAPLTPLPGQPAPAPGAAPEKPAPPAVQATPAREAFNNAQSLMQQKKYKEAIEGFNQAMALNPDDALKAEIMAATAESQTSQNDLEGARKTLLSLIDINRESPQAWSAVERLADIDIRENKPQDALHKLQLIEQNYPKYDNIARVKASIAHLQGQ